MKKTWFVDLTWPDEFYLEKVAQNMVHPIFLSKLLPKLYHGILCYFCDVSKLPKVNNHPIGKNTPNLVTLYPCRATISIYTLQEKLFLETQKSSPHF
jgi:hypothetical protein